MDMRSFAVMQDPTAAGHLLEPGCSLGPYLILEQLASSRYATIYLAHDVALDRAVVLKTASPDAGPTDIAGLRHEARALARARNPYLVTIHGLEDRGSAPVLVLEHLVGETLAERLARCGPLPVAATIELFIDLLTGLDHLHHAGIVHGGIKPDNIFLTTRGLPKFLGLQLAVFRDRPPTEPAARSPDLLYGAPEHRGTPTTDPRTDLFSLGLCLHEALTGALPFEKKDHPRSRRRQPPPALMPVLTRATSEDPDARFPSAAAFRRALVAAAPKGGMRGRARAGRGRATRLLHALAIDTALVAILAGLVFALGLYSYTEMMQPTTVATDTASADSRGTRPADNKAGHVDNKDDKYDALRRAWGG